MTSLRRLSVLLVGILAGSAALTTVSAPVPADAATPVRRVIPHDGATGIGSNPFDVAVDTGLHRAYVLNYGDKTISVIDTQTDAVITVIGRDASPALGGGMTHIAIDSVAHEAFVVDVQGQTVTIIDTTTNEVSRVIDKTQGIGSVPAGIGIDSTTHRAFVASYGDNTIGVIDITRRAVVRTVVLPAGSGPWAVAVDEKLHRAYVTNRDSGTVSVLDTDDGSVVTTIPHNVTAGIGDGPDGVASDPIRHKMYVAQASGGGTVAVIDTMSNTVVKILPHAPAGAVGIGSIASKIAVDPVSSTAYVVNGNDGTVSVVDTVTDVVTEVIAHDSATGIGSQPYGIGVDPGTQRVYVGNSSDNTVSVIGIQSNSAVTRIGGADRYAVSAAVSAATFSPGVRRVFVASGENYPDALSASAIAGNWGAPVLLVTHDSIPDHIAAEIRRLKPQGIIVVGGVNTISDGVATALQSYAPTTRVGGADRYAVAAELAHQQFGPHIGVVYVASGENFPDALSGSAAAGRGAFPVLLVTKTSVPDATAKELRRLQPERVIILGGRNSVSDATLVQLTKTPDGTPVVRLEGADRYVVSSKVSADTFRPGTSLVYIASGAVFPDALSGSAAAIAGGAPVLLVTKDGIPDAVAAELDRLNPRRIVVLGGADTVSDEVLRQLARYILSL